MSFLDSLIITVWENVTQKAAAVVLFLESDIKYTPARKVTPLHRDFLEPVILKCK